MTYRDPYTDHYGGDPSYPDYKDQGRDQESYGLENKQKVYQSNTWSQDTHSYGQDHEITYEDAGMGSTSAYHTYGPAESLSSYGYQSNNYNYPPVQRTLTDKRSKAVSKDTRPSLEVSPDTDRFRELGTGKDGFEKGEFTPNTPKKYRTPSAYRAYRYDNQGQLWTKGGLLWTTGRLCLCTILITLFLLVGIVLSLLLWMRPPNIKIGSVQPFTENGTVTLSGGGFKVSLAVPISVVNFNYFDVTMKKIQADIVYPINNTPLGGGTANDIVFKNGERTNFTFPFSLSYSPLVDSSGQVLADFAKKCGALGGQRSDMSVNYKITLGIQVLLFTVSPTVSNVFTFACPIKSSDISKIIKA